MGAGNGLTGGGTLSANRTFNVGAGWGITVSADAVAVNQGTMDARYLQTVTHVHGTPVVVTSAQSASNDTAAVTIDLGEANLDSYSVYINRMLMRPTEFTYSSNGNVSFAMGTLTTNDEVEIVGFKVV